MPDSLVPELGGAARSAPDALPRNHPSIAPTSKSAAPAAHPTRISHLQSDPWDRCTLVLSALADPMQPAIVIACIAAVTSARITARLLEFRPIVSSPM